jgi:hypothetical protein
MAVGAASAAGKLNYCCASTAWKIFKNFLGFGAESEAGSGAAAPVVGPAGPIFLKLGGLKRDISIESGRSHPNTAETRYFHRKRPF